MLTQPGMVRAALDGEIEREFQSLVRRRVAQRPKIVERAKRRKDRIVTPSAEPIA